MSEKPVTQTTLKACPFCGTEATKHNWYPDECMCMNDKCVLFSRVMKNNVWNTRFRGDGLVEILNPGQSPLEKGKLKLSEMLND